LQEISCPVLGLPDFGQDLIVLALFRQKHRKLSTGHIDHEGLERVESEPSLDERGPLQSLRRPDLREAAQCLSDCHIYYSRFWLP
jgi:hypothetical protein